MAAAIAMLARSMREDFRRVNPRDIRIVLVDMAQRVLGGFSEELSLEAQLRLERLGVELQLGMGADKIDDRGVVVGGLRIDAKTVIWTAGVAPSPAGKWLNAKTDRAGRVLVDPDLTVPGQPGTYVVGDTASMQQDGKPLPGVAQVALQQGRHAGKAIRQRIAGHGAPPPFRYVDQGSMAVVGQGFAILQTAKIRTSGRLVWLAWLGVHLWALAQPGLRVSVFAQWLWTLVTAQRGSRIILDHGGTTQVKAEGADDGDRNAAELAHKPTGS
jgi:NADH dehydrogenase